MTHPSLPPTQLDLFCTLEVTSSSITKKLAFAALLFTGNVDATVIPSSPPSMSTASSSTTTSWQWPSCAQARTMSFGRTDDGYDGEVSSTRKDCKTRVITNPAYCDDKRFSTIDSSASTTAPVSEADELIIRGIQSSSRLFFEPEATSSIMNKPSGAHAATFGGARALAIDSADPYGDFRRSMEEMVLSHGANGEDDWGWLEEMLGWYLRANGKKTHGLIVGAFVDLLVALTSSSPSIKHSDQC
ncbi:hypothetical protein ACQ4PT_067052 [Festuca glaucescens]